MPGTFPALSQCKGQARLVPDPGAVSGASCALLAILLCFLWPWSGVGGQHEPITGIRAGFQAGPQQLQVKLGIQTGNIDFGLSGVQP